MPTFGENPGERRVIQEVDPAEIRYAWFSEKMCLADGGEVTLYELEDGTVAEVTYVNTTPEHSCNWDDLQFLGKTTVHSYRGRRMRRIGQEHYLSLSFFLKNGEKKIIRFLDVPVTVSGETLCE